MSDHPSAGDGFPGPFLDTDHPGGWDGLMADLMGPEGGHNLDTCDKSVRVLPANALADSFPLPDHDVLADQQTDSDRHDDRLARYTKARLAAEAVTSWLVENEPDGFTDHLAAKLRDCGSLLTFRLYTEQAKTVLSGGCFCQQQKLYQMCALRYGARMLRVLLPKARNMLARYPVVPYLVTVTMKNGPDLKERMGSAREAYKTMVARARRQRHNAKWGKRTEMSSCIGGFRSMEIKRGSGSGEWHPHIHAVWFCDREPDAAALSSEWLQLTGDSHVVDVRPIRCWDEFGQLHDDGLIAGLLEVCKYVLKFSDLEPADCWHVHRTTRSRHLRQSFGKFRFTEEERLALETLTDDPLDGPYIELLYAWQAGGYQLVRSKPAADFQSVIEDNPFLD